VKDSRVADVSNSTSKWEVQLRKGCIELAVLASLWEGRLYGLEILRRLEYFSGLTVSEGTVYPLLSRLTVAGWVDAEWQESTLGHPRRYYTLTARGRVRIREMSRLWSKFRGNIDQLLVPLGKQFPQERPLPCNY
jgi:PadR family transcriptional regulator, regulatory protein PadR